MSYLCFALFLKAKETSLKVPHVNLYWLEFYSMSLLKPVSWQTDDTSMVAWAS